MGSPAIEPDNALTRIMRAATGRGRGEGLPAPPPTVIARPEGLTREETAYRDAKARELGLIGDVPDMDMSNIAMQVEAAQQALRTATGGHTSVVVAGAPAPFQFTNQPFRVLAIDFENRRVLTDKGYVELMPLAAEEFSQVASRYVLTYSIDRLLQVAESVGVALKIEIKNVPSVLSDQTSNGLPATPSAVLDVPPPAPEPSGPTGVSIPQGNSEGAQEKAPVRPRRSKQASATDLPSA